MASGVDYTFYEKDEAGHPRVVHTIKIKGGAAVASLKSHNGQVDTKMGMRTEVTDSDRDLLMTHPTFKTHLKNNCVMIADKKENPDKVAKDMGKDKSAPKTPKDYTDTNSPMPVPA
jgi:hypothetical protein